MTKRTTTIFIFIVLQLSFLAAQPMRSLYRLEIGGGASYLMPRDDYDNAWGLRVLAAWHISPRYALGINHSSSELDSNDGESMETISATGIALEISFKRGDPVASFTSIGMANVSGEDELLFMFGGGIRIPLGDKWLLRLSIRDYQSNIGIPFVSFPSGRIAVQGSGSNYLELGVTISRKLMEKKMATKDRTGRGMRGPRW
ncbi:MAG TPA: hypothetical protein EYO08_04510 [Candidatus Marinimicrobia bacterium]|nr:hypothetical protein [Candidatus Neomarinimicrobiota bacterium]